MRMNVSFGVWDSNRKGVGFVGARARPHRSSAARLGPLEEQEPGVGGGSIKVQYSGWLFDGGEIKNAGVVHDDGGQRWWHRDDKK